MADALGSLFQNSIGYAPNFLGDLPRAVYSVTGGMIEPTDRFLLVNSASAISLTLPGGIRDGQPLIVKNIGAGTLTLTATIDGTAGTTSVDSLGVLRLIWSAQFSTWLSI